MTLLDRLASLAQGDAPTLRARVPARFEPRSTDASRALDRGFDDADAARWGEIDAEREAPRPSPRPRRTAPPRTVRPAPVDEPPGPPLADDRVGRRADQAPAADHRPAEPPDRPRDEHDAPSVARASPRERPPPSPPDPARRPRPAGDRDDEDSPMVARPSSPRATPVDHPIVAPAVLRAVEPHADPDRADRDDTDGRAARPAAVDGDDAPAPVTVTIGHIEIRAVPAASAPAPVAPAPRRPRVKAGPDLASYLEQR